MKKTALFVVLVAISASAGADPSLMGQWKSDATLTMRFNTEHAQLEDKKAQLFSQLAGHLKITFTADTVTFDMPSIEVQASGKKSSLPGNREVRTYRVLGTTQNAVVVKSVDKITGKATIDVYNFEGPDTVWLYSGGADSVTPNTHLREYFIRVKTKNGFKADAPEGTRP